MLELPTITDETMRGRLAQAKPYTMLVLRATDRFVRPEVDAIIWEHGRRNMALVEAGHLLVVMPCTGGTSDITGYGVFAGTPEEVAEIIAGDPAVEAGLFDVEIMPVRGFPGAALV